MATWILLPPAAALIIFLAVIFLSRVMKGMSFKGELGAGAGAAYSCGEDMPDNSYRPDYGQFFPYAFFFTIMHVAALVLATVPSGDPGHYMLAALYVGAALIGLGAVLRKEK